MVHRPMRSKALALGALLSVILLLGLEAWARRVEPSRVLDASVPTPHGTGTVMPPHPYLLWEYQPGVWQEQGVTVRINSLGLRGPEPKVPKPPGVRRILATGDSSVYGYGVPESSTFVRVAADVLGGEPAGIEGLSAALPGYSTLQTLNLLQLRALRLQPDVLVVANLWSDHVTSALADAELADRVTRYDSSLLGALDRGLRRLALYRVLSWELAVRRGIQARMRMDWSPGVAPPEETRQRVPLADYSANLEAILRLGRAHGAHVAFLILPHPEDLHPQPTRNTAFYAYRDAMRSVALAHDAPLVEGGEVLARAAAVDPSLDEESLFLDRIHPSVAAHRLLGEALGQVVRVWLLEGAEAAP